jgi:hypothetical protein
MLGATTESFGAGAGVDDARGSAPAPPQDADRKRSDIARAVLTTWVNL